MNGKPIKQKRRGPKPKLAAEKPAQLTVRLEPETLFGLDVVARDRRTSLSGAAEHLISQQLKENALAARSTDDVRTLAAIFAKVEIKGIPSDLPMADRESAVVRLFLKSEGGRALFMPEALQQPIERYFTKLFWQLIRNATKEKYYSQLLGVFTSALLDPEKMASLMEAAQFLENGGLEVEEAAERYVRLIVKINT